MNATQTARGRLASLTARLAEAAAPGGSQDGEAAAIGWELVGELSAVIDALAVAETDRDAAAVAMRATVADVHAGGSDPISHLRRYLVPRGWLPPQGLPSLVILAWGPSGPPRAPGPHARATVPVLAVATGSLS